jgi:hypothetical protein
MQSAGLESGVTGRTPGDLRLAGLAGDMGATTLARGRDTKVILGPPRSLFGKTCVEASELSLLERASFLSSLACGGPRVRRASSTPSPQNAQIESWRTPSATGSVMAGREAMACSMACWFSVTDMGLPCLRAQRSFSTGRRDCMRCAFERRCS